jgi:hypothetical protein
MDGLKEIGPFLSKMEVYHIVNAAEYGFGALCHRHQLARCTKNTHKTCTCTSFEQQARARGIRVINHPGPGTLTHWLAVAPYLESGRVSFFMVFAAGALERSMAMR